MCQSHEVTRHIFSARHREEKHHVSLEKSSTMIVTCLEGCRWHDKAFFRETYREGRRGGTSIHPCRRRRAQTSSPSTSTAWGEIDDRSRSPSGDVRLSSTRRHKHVVPGVPVNKTKRIERGVSMACTERDDTKQYFSSSIGRRAAEATINRTEHKRRKRCGWTRWWWRRR
eukprot:scaffold75593_cov43-Cyclotella_meneghiniana.AAC.1